MFTAGRIESFGFAEAKRFADALEGEGWPLNESFGGKPVLAGQPAPVVTLADGLRITLLSPTVEGLRRLGEERDARGRRSTAAAVVPSGVEGFAPRKFHEKPDVAALVGIAEVLDRSAINGSSIAFVAEWRGCRALMAADAHPDVLARGLRDLSGDDGRYRVDLFKASHHGSAANCSRALVEAMACRRYLISTSGSRHGHPDPAAIARLLAFSPAGPKAIFFNYAEHNAKIWNADDLMARHDYRCHFPVGSSEAIVVDVCAARTDACVPPGCDVDERQP